MNFSVDWWSQHIPVWEKIVIPALFGKKEIEVMEIGAFEGRSSLWICENILQEKGSHLTVIDTFEGSPEHKEMGVSTKNIKEIFAENTKQYKEKISVFVGRSQDILREEGFDQPWYDLIYIDGSHKAFDVYEDAVLSWKSLKSGGVIVFDDYLWELGQTDNDRPKMGIDLFLRNYTKKFKILNSGYQLIIQKI